MKEELDEYIKRSLSTAPDRLRSYAYALEGKPLFYRFAFYTLKKLVDDFIAGKKENRWIVLPGLRGSGKTTLLAQLYFYLLSKGVSLSNVLYISLDEVVKLIGSNLKDALSSYEAVLGRGLESLDRDVFLLVDEAHYDKNWGAALKSVFDRTKNVFIVSTGSSALLLQSTPDIARRAQVEEVFPLTFSEYIMLKYREKPQPGLREGIMSILFFSRTAEEVFLQLKNLEPVVSEYWSKVKPFEIENYLRVGTLPFSIPFEREEYVYPRIVSMLEKIINDDIPALKDFSRETLNKVWNLLLLLSTSEKVSYESLSKSLGVSKLTIIELLDVLKKTEIVYPLRPYGSVGKVVRKEAKYRFLAPAIRSALLWSIGKNITQEMYGKLFEDVVSLYLQKIAKTGKSISFYYDSQRNGADFIISLADGSRIILEVGYGDKGISQIKTSLKKVMPKYSLLVSERSLELDAENNIVFIPKQFFLLM